MNGSPRSNDHPTVKVKKSRPDVAFDANYRLQLQPLILGKELCDLGVDLLLRGEAGLRVAEIYQVLDPMLQSVLLRLRLSALTDLIFIVH